ncbi:hypothetical protein JOF57_000842 [Mycolicibacterium lutetiense]|uniref:Uncharacterized protein n=1 Tax=Mycolicibacterium lutetiense TaxID=1641992 RepID=A0ABS4ZN78_9MYCO|nr:hypothetical protein [Mycolicibacterium lutetiense]
MSDPLQFSIEGLGSASAGLSENADQAISATRTTGSKTGKPSSEGITDAATAVAAFGRAFQSRIQSHAQSAQAAAGSYSHTDDSASDAITRTV